MIDVTTDVMAALDRRIDDLLASHPPSTTDAAGFLGAQFDAGLAYVQFPEGYGGLGLSPALQAHVETRLQAAGAPSAFRRNPIGFGMGAPTVLTYGSEGQKRRYLRPLFTGEHVWCQMFSEPGAGSDVASLATRAVRDGDQWVVTGQKVWTSLAHRARYGMLLTRTDPDVPKHAGMTYFVLDMQAPGVDVRPLRQMTGEAEFNEVFFDEVRIPDGERLGGVNEGWKVAMTTLMFERFNTGDKVPRGGGSIALALREWSRRGDTASPAARALKDRLVRCWIDAELHRLTKVRAAQRRDRGTPGPEGSVGKLQMANLNQAIFDLAVDLVGADGMLYPSGYEMTHPDTMGFDPGVDPMKALLRAQANSLEGGSSDIMRNILGERVLGLPPDVRVDKAVPWSQVPRSGRGRQP
jgi:alkylation response protein AidB-like acyl-CoA dehydrogenase